MRLYAWDFTLLLFYEDQSHFIYSFFRLGYNLFGTISELATRTLERFLWGTCSFTILPYSHLSLVLCTGQGPSSGTRVSSSSLGLPIEGGCVKFFPELVLWNVSLWNCLCTLPSLHFSDVLFGLSCPSAICSLVVGLLNPGALCILALSASCRFSHVPNTQHPVSFCFLFVLVCDFLYLAQSSHSLKLNSKILAQFMKGIQLFCPRI